MPPVVDPNSLRYLCQHFADRNMVLFTGAGVNAKVTNSKGREFPMGSALSKSITSQLLGDMTLEMSLVDAADIAEYKVSRRTLNSFIYDQLSGFPVGAAHSLLATLPFHSIYTTNYDTLLEQAFAASHESRLVSICSERADLSDLGNEAVPYYKIHGSIDMANTDDGRLILTRRDYDYYEQFRKRLFRRLSQDITSKSFLFVGYSLSDSNILTLINDCRDQLGVSDLPRSYALMRKVTPVQAEYWRGKYNIELIESDIVEFLSSVHEAFRTFGITVQPAQSSASPELLEIDPSASLPIFANAYYILDVSRCSGASSPQRYFKGAEPTWADIRENVPPNRDDYETLSNTLLEDVVRPEAGAQICLVSGHAGTGKTTLIRTCTYELALNLSTPVYFHIPGTPIDCRVFSALHNPESPQRIIVVFHSAAQNIWEIAGFFEEARSRGLPLTVLMEERNNQWNSVADVHVFKNRPARIDLGKLSDAEIERILDALAKHNCLDHISTMSREEQRRHFQSLADKELLVALRELTLQTSFDKIIKDEYLKIPTPEGRMAYLYAACVGQVDLPLLYQNLMRITGVPYDQLAEKVFRATEGVLLSGEVRGYSRYNFGFKVTTRHPIIASVIFELGAPTDREKYEVINNIITYADRGFKEDERLLRDITRRRELVETISDPEIRRAIYDRLMEILPNDPYVFQHRSILERDLGNPPEAIKYARKAIEYGNSKPMFLTNLGFAFEAEAKITENLIKRKGLLDQAEKIFRDVLQKVRGDPYPYVGLSHALKQKAEMAATKRDAELIRAEIISLLKLGVEATEGDNVVVTELGRCRKDIADKATLLETLTEGLKAKPNDPQLRDVLVEFHLDNGNRQQALAVATEGTKLDPTAWRLHRRCARMHRENGAAESIVSSHYASAVRHNSNDVGLLVEFGEFLHSSGNYPEASNVFDRALSLRKSGNGQYVNNVIWAKSSDGKRKQYKGKVHTTGPKSGTILSVPENFPVHFWRENSYSRNLRQGDEVRFELGFNSFGALSRFIS